MQDTINVCGIVAESITDGPGIRYTVFCQGCIHKCNGCHNPESWPFEGGTIKTAEELVQDLKSHTMITGITFSGGEPFCQAEGFVALAKLCKQLGLEIACYTGYTLEFLLTQGTKAQIELLNHLDVLVDGKFEIGKKTLAAQFKGSSNQRVLDVKKSLATNTAVLMQDGRWNKSDCGFDDMFPPVQIDYKF